VVVPTDLPRAYALRGLGEPVREASVPHSRASNPSKRRASQEPLDGILHHWPLVDMLRVNKLTPAVMYVSVKLVRG
jgi:hypothetical protein